MTCSSTETATFDVTAAPGTRTLLATVLDALEATHRIPATAIEVAKKPAC